MQTDPHTRPPQGEVGSGEGSFAPFEAELKRAGAAPIVVDTFRHYFEQLRAGHSGVIAEQDIEPIDDLPDAERLPPADRSVLAHTAVIKLNGGLGTSMGLDRAKSLLEAKDGLTFLDVIARQVLALRRSTKHPVPLVMMNSFGTHDDTAEALKAYPELEVEGIPLAFLQNKVLKVLADGHGLPDPGEWGEHAWVPPGHGDLYTALKGSAALDALLDHGFTHAFVSNADNLGATLDPRILGYMLENDIPFLMEVAGRTEADRKGGHLARRKSDGRLLLREVAQTAPDDLAQFQDIGRHRFFNTNSIWMDLRAVRDHLRDNGGIFRLPLIRNKKTLDPRNAETPSVFHLETAMGAAIELFDGAQALRVPRTRFAPVKLCSDLLVLWSDAYELDDDYHLVPMADPAPVVELDPRYYRLVDDMQRRFPHGAPSLRACRRLRVRGDVTFGRAVAVLGDVTIEADSPRHIEDGTVLS